MKLITHLILACALLPGLNAHAEIAVITDPSVELTSLDIEQLERLYLLRPNRFPGGVRLIAIDQKAGSEIRQAFLQKALWKTEIDVAEYWSRRMFSGKGRPPRQFDGDAAVIDEVIDSPGTIGYVDSESVDDRVKVLTRLP
jgi:ABC-type phosphate transport system substrate-binding protein